MVLNSSHVLSAHICSGVDVYTALAGAVGALYGPLHGGANEVSIYIYIYFHLNNKFTLGSSNPVVT